MKIIFYSLGFDVITPPATASDINWNYIQGLIEPFQFKDLIWGISLYLQGHLSQNRQCLFFCWLFVLCIIEGNNMVDENILDFCCEIRYGSLFIYLDGVHVREFAFYFSLVLHFALFNFSLLVIYLFSSLVAHQFAKIVFCLVKKYFSKKYGLSKR
ncbi:hypothetical protein ACJX0J_017906, partial [Zea mays]